MFAKLLDRGRALPGVEEGTHTGSLHKLVRVSQKPNGYRRTVDLLVGQLAAVPQGIPLHTTHATIPRGTAAIQPA